MRLIVIIGLILASSSTHAQLLELELQNARLRAQASLLKEKWVTNQMNALHGLLYGKQLYQLNQFEEAEPHYLKALDEDLLQQEELYQLIHILIANKKTALALDLQQLLKSKESTRYRLINQIMTEARQNDEQNNWAFQYKYEGRSPVISDGKLLFSKDKSLLFEANANVNEIKIKGIKEKYVRHAFISASNENIWITHPVDGRFRISTSAKKKNMVYRRPKEFVGSDKKSNYIHASLNAAGDILIFSSDKPGGYGGFDLYMSFKGRDGWTSPKNLGPVINTPKNEIMPWLSAANEIYFSSDGLPGLGGYDVFRAELADISATLSHLPYPFNSAQDELGFCRKSADVCFVGKRLNDKYDIVRFWKKEDITPQTVNIQGLINSSDGSPVPSALVLWELNERGVFTETNERGQFSIDMSRSYGKNLELTVRKSDYQEQQVTVEWSAIVNGIYRMRPLKIELQPIASEKPQATKVNVQKADPPAQKAKENRPEDDQPVVQSAPPAEKKVTPQPSEPKVIPKQQPTNSDYRYYVVMASSTNEPDMKRLRDQYLSRFPDIQLLQSNKGYIRLAVPAGYSAQDAIPVLKECRKIVSDCWVLKEKSTQ